MREATLTFTFISAFPHPSLADKPPTSIMSPKPHTLSFSPIQTIEAVPRTAPRALTHLRNLFIVPDHSVKVCITPPFLRILYHVRRQLSPFGPSTREK